MNKVLFCYCLLLIVGCVQAPKKDLTEQPDRLAKLNKMNQQKLKQEESKKLNDVLQLAKQKRIATVAKNYPMPAVLTEENLYAFLLQTYQSRDLNGLEFYVKEFVQKYPKSVFADNSLYLSGQLKLLMGLPGEALRDFERVQIEYPMGNKRVAALFGKAIAYKKLGLTDYTKKIFTDLKSDYPGSPEFYKVELEEKLMSVE